MSATSNNDLSTATAARVDPQVDIEKYLFNPKDSHHTVEILKRSSLSETDFYRGELRENEISEWVTQRAFDGRRPLSDVGSRTLLQLLILHPREAQGTQLLPIPTTPTTFRVVEKAWKLPPYFMESIRREIPIAANFLDSGLDPEMIGLIIRSVTSLHWQFCLFTNFNRITGTTSGIICGLKEAEINIFIEELKNWKEHATDPMLVPVMAVRALASLGANGIEGSGVRTTMLEKHIGLVKQLQKDTDVRQIPQPALNFDEVTRDLTSEIRDLSYWACVFEGLLRALDVIQATFELRNLDKAPGPLKHQPIRSTIGYLKSLILGAQTKESDLTRSVQAQIQNVFSLIAQRDNRLNIEMATSSREIAEASQRDSAAMKAIAEDSKRVALATQKDSASMRIIAAVTVVFLPGTFTATLFSASFFDFSSTSAAVVSRWIWLYVVITLTLTVGVCGLWWFRSAQREKDIDKQYGEEKEKTS